MTRVIIRRSRATYRDWLLWQGFVRRLISRFNPARRRRASPWVIKRTMPRWHVKRAHHTDWHQPQQPGTYTAQPVSLNGSGGLDDGLEAQGLVCA